MARADIGLIECPHCGFPDAHVREQAKSGRVYLLCEECEVQTFSRGQKSDAAIRARMRPVLSAPDPRLPQLPGIEPAAAPVKVPEKAEAGGETLFDLVGKFIRG